MVFIHISFKFLIILKELIVNFIIDLKIRIIKYIL